MNECSAGHLQGHADFIAAPERRRYVGALAGLWVLLNMEIQEVPQGQWAWRVLRSGALVALRLVHGGKRQLKIARSQPFKTGRGPAGWEAEIATFLKYFPEAARWEREDAPGAAGAPATFFFEAEAGVARSAEPEQTELL